MKYFLLLTVVAVAAAVPLELVEDVDGEQYYLVPINREKRQTKWDVSNSGVSLGHTGTILDNQNHRLDGTGTIGKSFSSPGLRPDQIGGRLDYAHKPTGSNAFLSVDHARGYGTDAKAGVQYNIYKNRDWEAGINGGYNRHFGGPSGTGRADPFVGFGVRGRF